MFLSLPLLALGEGATLLPGAGLLPDPFADSTLLSSTSGLTYYFLGPGLEIGLCSGLV